MIGSDDKVSSTKLLIALQLEERNCNKVNLISTAGREKLQEDKYDIKK